MVDEILSAVLIGIISLVFGLILGGSHSQSRITDDCDSAHLFRVNQKVYTCAEKK